MSKVHHLPAPAAALILVLAAACSSSTSPSTTFRWAGTYAAQTRAGGCTAAWGNATQGNQVLVVTPQRVVIRDSVQIMNPTVTDSTISWSMADGNQTNASITFEAASSSTCDWGASGQTGPLFQGSIQYPGQGPLDYRGLKQ